MPYIPIVIKLEPSSDWYYYPPQFELNPPSGIGMPHTLSLLHFTEAMPR